jgi:hypothetical protein
VKKQSVVLAISLFIDSFGLVIARLVVVTIVCLFGSAPAFVGTAIVTTYFPVWNIWASAYCFYSFAILLLFALFLRTGALGRARLGLKEGFTNLLTYISLFILVATASPFVILLSMLIRKDTGRSFMLAPRHYMNEKNVKTLIFYIDAVLAFGLGVYLLSLTPQRELFFEAGHEPKGLSDAILYTLDVVIRGFMFDFLEHFNVHISNVEHSSNLLSKIISYSLRLASTVLAIALVLEMITATKEKLESLDTVNNTETYPAAEQSEEKPKSAKNELEAARQINSTVS